jgi:4,5:9,10-diseco-3-hydroxy-5,9,17-trioxoandrosta-1(10),2-diene-4-oate hydrolase
MSARQPEDRYIKVGNINTRYWAAGDKGSAVVLVHGLGGCIENWVYNVDPLAQRHRVYALDLLGFGRSDKTPLIHDFNILVKLINDFMKVMNIEKTSLIGHSLGGGLVLQFALDYPDKVAKLVLMDNAGMGREVITDFKICSLPILGELLTRPSLQGTARLWQEIVYDAGLVTPELVDMSYGIMVQPGAKKALLSTLRAGINFRGQRTGLVNPLINKLGKITALTLVVWGQQDIIIPVAHAQVAVNKIPGARLEIFDRCGHMPMFEHPGKFNKLVLDFLAE